MLSGMLDNMNKTVSSEQSFHGSECVYTELNISFKGILLDKYGGSFLPTK